MGTSLLKNYSVDKESYMEGGFNSLWKIYKGHSNLKEGDLASVFVFEKKRLEKYRQGERRNTVNFKKRSSVHF